jgi:hypothetical protein
MLFLSCHRDRKNVTRNVSSASYEVKRVEIDTDTMEVSPVPRINVAPLDGSKRNPKNGIDAGGDKTHRAIGE